MQAARERAGSDTLTGTCERKWRKRRVNRATCAEGGGCPAPNGRVKRATCGRGGAAKQLLAEEREQRAVEGAAPHLPADCR